MILYLGNKLSQHGNTPTSVETLGEKLKDFNYQVVTKSSFRNKLLRMADMAFAIVKHKSKKPVVLIDTYSTSAFWFAYLSARLCTLLHIPYISILRGGDLPSRIDRSKKTTTKYFNNSFANVATSEYLHAEFKMRNLPVQVIHNYIDIRNYPFKLRDNLQPNLLWVRSFHSIYNPQLALEVFKKILQVFPGATLCMVGPDKDGSLATCKKKAEEMKINVLFKGRLKKEEWIALSANYDLFINTTDVDNTPVSLMEAMALGMPVVTTNAGGIPYLFKNDLEGVMVSPNNADEMTQCILSLLNNSSKSRAISAAARKKAEEWDWEIIGPYWKKLIDSAIKNKVS